MPNMWEVTPEVWNDGRGRYYVAQGDGRVVVAEHSSPTFEGQYLEFTPEQWREIVKATMSIWLPPMYDRDVKWEDLFPGLERRPIQRTDSTTMTEATATTLGWHQAKGG